MYAPTSLPRATLSSHCSQQPSTNLPFSTVFPPPSLLLHTARPELWPTVNSGCWGGPAHRLSPDVCTATTAYFTRQGHTAGQRSPGLKEGKEKGRLHTVLCGPTRTASCMHTIAVRPSGIGKHCNVQRGLCLESMDLVDSCVAPSSLPSALLFSPILNKCLQRWPCTVTSPPSLLLNAARSELWPTVTGGGVGGQAAGSRMTYVEQRRTGPLLPFSLNHTQHCTIRPLAFRLLTY